MTISVGIDIGGTKIEIIALDDIDSTELFRKRVSTPSNYNDFLKTNIDLINEAKTTVGEIDHIGVGIPGIIHQDGTIGLSINFGFIKPSFIHELSKKINMPVLINNDANCFALSESYDGAGKNYNIVSAVIIGTGIGAGLVINKKLRGGAHSITGEWGQIPLNFLKPNGTTRNTDSVETNISGPALMTKYNNITHKNVKSVKDIVTAADTGEKVAIDILDGFYDTFARMLLISLIIIDPDVYILGGGLSKIKDIYTKVPTLVTKYAKEIFGKDIFINLLPAQHGDASGARGAAWLWRNKIPQCRLAVTDDEKE